MPNLNPRLLAEVEVWPLVPTLALRPRPLRLRREAVGVFDKATGQLAEALESYLRLRSRGMSLASLAAVRDRCWFNGRDQDPQAVVEVSLSEYTVTLAQRYLARAGPRIIVRMDRDNDGTDIADRIAHWRWLSLRLPADLLISALYAGSGVPPADRVSLATVHLERLLQRPAAETHLHVGAAFGFPVLWTSWMVWLTHGNPDVKKPSIPKDHVFKSGEGMRGMLLAAGITRVLLAAFLWQRELRLFKHGFTRFEEESLPSIFERIHWPSGTAEAERLCSHVLASLLGAADLPSFARAQRLYAALVRTDSRRVWKRLDVTERAR